MTEKSGREELAVTRVHDLEREGILTPGAWNRSERIFAKVPDASASKYLMTVIGKAEVSTRGDMKASAPPSVIIDGLITAAEGLPVAHEDDIQYNYDFAGPKWGAREILILTSDELRRRLETVCAADVASSNVTSIKPDHIEAVIVTRDGPIPPTIDEALEVVPRFVSFIAGDAPLIHIRPSKPGLMADKAGRDELALTRINDLERDGVLARGAWNRSELILAKTHDAPSANYLIIVVGKSDTPAPRGTPERAFILYGGNEPDADEGGEIIREFEQDTGISLRGMTITSFGCGTGEPSETIAKFLVDQLESEGEVSAGALQRTVVRAITVNGERRIFAVVLQRKDLRP